MSMYTVTIDKARLAGCRNAAGEKDVRYYLNGVYMELESGVMVATDGAMMFVAASGHGPIPNSGAPSIILPNEWIDSVLKVAKYETALTVDIDAAQPVATVSVTIGGATLKASCIDGKFPDWRRVVRFNDTEELAQFDPRLLASLQECFRLAMDERKTAKVCVNLRQQGNSAAIMYRDANTDMFGVLMPWRTGEPGFPEALALAGMKAPAAVSEAA